MKPHWYTKAGKGMFYPFDRIGEDIYNNNRRGGGDQYIQVILDRVEWRQGEEVTGRVILNLTEKILDACVVVEFHGEYYTEHIGHAIGDNPFPEQIELESGVMDPLVLSRFPLDRETGRFSFPFSFFLDEPSVSMQWEDGKNGFLWVLYAVKASLRRGSDILMVDWQELRLLDDPEDFDQNPVCHEDTLKDVVVKLNFDKGTYSPGETIHCRAEIQTGESFIKSTSLNLNLYVEMYVVATEHKWTASNDATIEPNSKATLDYALRVPDDLPSDCSYFRMSISSYLELEVELANGKILQFNRMPVECFYKGTLISDDGELREMSLYGTGAPLELSYQPKGQFVDPIRFITGQKTIQAGGCLEGIILVKHQQQSQARLQLSVRGTVEIFQQEHSNVPILESTFCIDDSIPAESLLSYPVRIPLEDGLFGSLYSVTARDIGRISYQVSAILYSADNQVLAQHHQPIFITESPHQPCHVAKGVEFSYFTCQRTEGETTFWVKEGYLTSGQTATGILHLCKPSSKIAFHLRKRLVIRGKVISDDKKVLLSQRSALPCNVDLSIPFNVPWDVEPSVSHPDCQVSYELEIILGLGVFTKMVIYCPIQVVARH